MSSYLPQFEARRLHQVWRPILNHIEQQTGYRLELVDQFSIDFSAHYVKTHDSVYLNCDKAHQCGYSGQSDSAKRQFKWSDAIQIIDWPT